MAENTNTSGNPGYSALIAAINHYYGKNYIYSQTLRTQPGYTDCSALVYTGLKEGGFNVPNNTFTTSQLFNGSGSTLTQYAQTGRFIWDGTNIKIQSAGETGGNEAVSGVMQSVITAMNSLIEQQRLTNPTSSLGIIANRMPTVAYDMSGYRYTDIDPLTGEEKHPSLRFDTSGNPYNATAGSVESYRSIGEAIIMSALSRSAIAPMWEVQTAKMQTDAGDPKAGLTEEARANNFIEKRRAA